jgi:TPR repeat protein
VTGLAGLRPVRRRMLAAWAFAIVVGACLHELARHAYDTLPRPHPLEELSYYPSGQFLRPATLGHAEAAADLSWLRAVQYYGEHRRSDNRFSRMAHVFDILTTLSPTFVPSYVFGAFALAQEGGQFQAAERLMLKGLAANPTSAELAFKLGFLYYVRPGGRDLPRAAEYFELSARLPNPPPQARRFAAFCRQHGGELPVAYALWEGVYRETRNRYLRAMAEREMRQIREAMATGRTESVIRRLAVPRVRIQGVDVNTPPPAGS